MFRIIVASLLIGAFVTSYVEYRLNYNLYDLLKDKVFGLFGKKG